MLNREVFADEVFSFHIQQAPVIKSVQAKEKLETAVLSESALEKDWFRPEEDEAWQDL